MQLNGQYINVSDGIWVDDQKKRRRFIEEENENEKKSGRLCVRKEIYWTLAFLWPIAVSLWQRLN